MQNRLILKNKNGIIEANKTNESIEARRKGPMPPKE